MAIYLDSNATTPLATEVVEAISDSLVHAWGNPSSTYEAGTKAKVLIQEARKNVASCIMAEASDIIFTSGGSESNNWVIRAAIELFCSNCNSCEKPHVVISTVEHDSIVVPLDLLAGRGIIDLTKIPIDIDTGEIMPSDVADAVQSNTCLISIMMANNETGTIMPIKDISAAVRIQMKKVSSNALLHTDAAQTIGKVPVDVSELDVDLLTIVGHKFYGPRIGALYVKNLESRRGKLHPLIYGGGQECGWRAGTENTPMISGLGAAAKLIHDNLHQYSATMKHTRDFLERKLLETFGKEKLSFNCKSKNRLPNTCNVSILGTGLEGYKILQKAKSFTCSTGSACHSDKCLPSKILISFHINNEIASNALRISTGRNTSEEDINKVIKELQNIVTMLSTAN